MLFGPKVTFVGFDPSPLLRHLLMRRIAALERFDTQILSCTVVVEPLGDGLQEGNPVRVHVIVILPGPDISVSRDSGLGPVQRDLRLAVSQAFDAMEAELRRHHGDATPIIPTHQPHFLHGRIVEMDPDRLTGLVHGQDGRDYPFGPTGLGPGIGGIARIGSRVRFRLQEGTAPPFAIRISPLERPTGGRGDQ
jgi:hypothetical protein